MSPLRLSWGCVPFGLDFVHGGDPWQACDHAEDCEDVRGHMGVLPPPVIGVTLKRSGIAWLS